MPFTSILEEASGSEIDSVNTVIVFLLTLVSGIILSFYGINNGNTTLGFIGLLFSILSLTGVIIIELMGGSFFKNATTVGQAHFAFWLPVILINIGSLFSGIKSTFSAVTTTPGKTYAAGALSGEPAGIQTFTEVILAPQGENLALFGLGILFVKLGIAMTGDDLWGMILGLIPLGGTFMLIHTQDLSQISFIATAFALMFTMGGILYGTDLGLDVPLHDTFLATIAFFGGLHFGLNSSNTHGLLGVFFQAPDGILNIPNPELQLLAQVVTVVYGASFLIAAQYGVRTLAAEVM
jgi:hypothetical protein